MKAFGKSLGVVFAGVMAGLSSATAAERAPITVLACYDAREVQIWRYIQSPNVYNGVRERAAYIELVFGPARDSRGVHELVAREPLPGMTWDKEFKHVYFAPGDGVKPVLCAKETFFGQHRFLKICDLEGKLTERPDLGRSDCEGANASLFEGAIVIRN